MKESQIFFLSLLFFIMIFLGIFIFWLNYNPVLSITIAVPVEDAASSEKIAFVKIGEYSKTFAHASDDLSGSWSCFRGESRDNINKESIPVAPYWKEAEPEILWTKDMGEGHSAPAIFRGKLYILDYDEVEKADSLRCFTLKQGQELWRRWYKVNVKRNHGMSRTIPAINEKFIVTIGPKCHVMCVNRENGDFLWGMDLEKEFGTKIPLWYTGQCPILDGNTVLIAPCGERALIIGVDCATGKILWETPNPKKWDMSHSSIMPMEWKNRKMFLYAALGGIAGISPEGQILWESDAWNPQVIAPSPLVLDDGRIFLTAGYGAGSMVLQLTEEEGKIHAKKIWQAKPEEGLASEQQTPLFYKGHIFGILPKDAGALRNQFACYHSGDINKPLWSSGKTNRFGLGPYFVAEDKFFILSDDGTLTMIAASVEGYKELGEKKIFQGKDAWGPMALADGFLLLRDEKKLFCLSLRKDERK